MADFTLEKENYHKNYYMIGVDEAGRGSWAGPIVATACWLDYKKHELLSEYINDSKKINSIKRKNEIIPPKTFGHYHIPTQVRLREK